MGDGTSDGQSSRVPAEVREAVLTGCIISQDVSYHNCGFCGLPRADSRSDILVAEGQFTKQGPTYIALRAACITVLLYLYATATAQACAGCNIQLGSCIVQQLSRVGVYIKSCYLFWIRCPACAVQQAYDCPACRLYRCTCCCMQGICNHEGMVVHGRSSGMR